MNSAFTATGANGNPQNLFSAPGQGTIVNLNSFYPEPADEIELDFTQGYQEIIFNGTFGLQYNGLGGTLPNDAVIALKLTIDVCAL